MYNRYSVYLKEKYGEKVYKLPISLKETTCPNRDGNIGLFGCTYCGEKGTGFENLSSKFSVYEQLEKNMKYIRKKYNAKKFIAYFQSYSNTYLPISLFESYVKQAIIKDVVDISISTRPDCIREDYMKILQKIKNEYRVDITIELGLQTANYKTLSKINRGHSLAEYISGANMVKRYGFNLCTHLILNLPWDTIEDTIETAKIVTSLNTDFVKMHALYIEKDTLFQKQYENGEFEIAPVDDYVERVVTFLEYLSKNIAVQRIVSRAPEENVVFSNWNMSWWKIRDMIELKMENENRFQGKLHNNKMPLSKFDDYM